MPDVEPTEPEAVVTPEPAPEAAPAEPTELTPEQYKAKIAELNRENASWRVKYREAEPLVQKAKELEEASKTEAQKLADAHKSAEERATAAESRLARLDACLKSGLDPKFAGRLQGATAEELEADAKELSELFAAKAPDTPPAPSPGRKPQPRLDSARPTPGAPDESLDPAKIAAAAIRDMY